MPTDLNFSVAQSFPVGLVDIPFGGPGPGDQEETLVFLASIPAPTANFSMFYDNAVARGPASHTYAAWRDANKSIGLSAGRFGDTQKSHVETDGNYQDGRPAASLTVARLRDLNRSNRPSTTARFVDGRPLRGAASDTFVDLVPTRQCVRALFADGVGISQSGDIGFRDLARTQRPLIDAPWTDGRPLRGGWCDSYQTARPLPAAWCSAFTDARHQTGRGGPIVIVPPPVVEPDPCYVPPAGSVGLVFVDPLLPVSGGPVLLNFFCFEPPEPTVPIRTVYFVSNSVTLIRLPDLVEIPVFSLSIGIDADSWAWTLQATVPGSSLPLLEPVAGVPRTLEATVNGFTWQFMSESLGRSRVFGKSRVTIRGRSRSAELADPYAAPEARTITANRTAQQLVNDVLTFNGQPIGWTVDWQLTDWLVTAGAWSHEGTYIESVLNIASSVQAVVQSDLAQSILSIAPRYPVLPWNWAGETPAATITEDLITQEGIQWEQKPNYDAVIVSGQNQGIVGDVRRQGSSGNTPAPLVIDPLITHSDAARQRGEAIFGNTGRQAMVSLSMPLDSSLGLDLFTPGQLLEISGADTWRGLVRGVQLSAELPRVRQAVTLERHYL